MTSPYKFYMYSNLQEGMIISSIFNFIGANICLVTTVLVQLPAPRWLDEIDSTKTPSEKLLLFSSTKKQ